MANQSHVTLTFWIPGTPQQRGSKTPWIPRRRDGSPVTRANGGIVIATMDSNKKSKAWMTSVRETASAAMHRDGITELFGGPVKLVVSFLFARPASHYGSGKNAGILKKSHPPDEPMGQGVDLDKLLRGIGDGMTGVVYRDDRQICEVVARKCWTVGGAGAQVSVERLGGDE